MDNKLLILGGSLGILISGCALTPDTVSIRPTVEDLAINVGRGQQVWINISDDRPSNVIGTRDVLGVGGQVTVAGDLSSSIKNAVTDGLKKQGFKVVDSSGPESRELRIVIHNFRYKNGVGFASGKLDITFELEGVCAPDSAGYYENFYLGEDKEDPLIAPTSGQNEEYINIAISQAINKLLRDSKLTACLINFK